MKRSQRPELEDTVYSQVQPFGGFNAGGKELERTGELYDKLITKNNKSTPPGMYLYGLKEEDFDALNVEEEFKKIFDPTLGNFQDIKKINTRMVVEYLGGDPKQTGLIPVQSKSDKGS
jgi:hypothetical protein